MDYKDGLISICKLSNYCSTVSCKALLDRNGNGTTVDSRYLEPSKEIEKRSSYREFELSRVKLYRK